jgi:hypothetical protein
MNLRHLVAVALGCAAVLRSQTPGDAFRKRPVVVSNRIQMYAELTQSPFRVGQPVEIAIRLKNVSATSVRVGDSNPAVDFELVVTDAAGSEPPRTEYGKRAFNMEIPILRAATLDLDPGQEVQNSLDVAKIYQLRPGSYLARVALGLFPGQASRPSSTYDPTRPVEKAFSNLVQFTVVP